MYISSYQDTLIYNLHPNAFAIRFGRVALGWRLELARKPGWTPE
jgi:hypothetical protein